jgi:hypothetical protein
MVYADGSNPSVRKDIGVRLPSPAQCFGLSGGFSPPPPVFANGANGAKDDLGDVRGYVTVQTLGDVGVTSKVIDTLACPSRSWTTLGCSPACSASVA